MTAIVWTDVTDMFPELSGSITKNASAIDDTLDTYTVASHGVATGQIVEVATDGGVIPTNLLPDVDYYGIAIDVDTLQFALTLADAINATPVFIDFVGGSGQQQIVVGNGLGISAAAQQLIVDYVNSVVAYRILGGEDHPRTKLARIYLAAHLASRAGGSANGGAGGVSGPVSSESVGGISVSYATVSGWATQGNLSITAYGQLYLSVVNNSPARAPIVI